MRFPFLAKLAAAGFVALLVYVPVLMMQGKIAERQSLNHQARSSIAKASAGAQRIVLPLIEHVCRETVVTERIVRVLERDRVVSDTKEREVACGRVTPDTLQIEGEIMAADELWRPGIFSARLYNARLRVSGKLKMTEPDLSGPHQRRHLGAFFAVDLNGAQGIRNATTLTVGAQRIEFKPGARLPDVPHGIHAPLAGVKAGEAADFSIGIDFLGMEEFALGPLAKKTAIALKSNWPHPGFSGNFLPDSKTISASGFEATWSMNEFALQGTSARASRAAPAAAPGQAAVSGQAPALGISLVEPVNLYSQSYRSV